MNIGVAMCVLMAGFIALSLSVMIIFDYIESRKNT